MTTDSLEVATANNELGPKMLACSGRERKFVWALASGQARDAGHAAQLAGYGATRGSTASSGLMNSNTASAW